MTDDISAGIREMAQGWLIPSLDKLEILSPDAKANHEMHTDKLAQALTNAWQRATEQALKDVKAGTPPSARKDLFTMVVREYVHKNVRPEFKEDLL